jgi:hypothetical protein
MDAERVTRAPFVASAAPIWMADSMAVLLTGSRTPRADPGATFVAPVAPLTSGPSDSAYRLERTGTAVSELRFGVGSAVLGVGTDGRVAYADREGRLRVADNPLEAPFGPALTDHPVTAVALAPSEPAAVVAFGDVGELGAIELVDLTTGERTPLVPRGADPRWLP